MRLRTVTKKEIGTVRACSMSGYWRSLQLVSGLADRRLAPAGNSEGKMPLTTVRFWTMRIGAMGQSLKRRPWQIWSERHLCRAGVSIPSQMRMHVFNLRSALFTNRQIDTHPSPARFCRVGLGAVTPIACYSNGWETGRAKAAFAFIISSQSSGGFPLSSIALKTAWASDFDP